MEEVTECKCENCEFEWTKSLAYSNEAKEKYVYTNHSRDSTITGKTRQVVLNANRKSTKNRSTRTTGRGAK